MTGPDLLLSLRDYLADEGLVRDPETAGAAAPAWIHPQDGVPAPGEGASPLVGATLVIGIYRATGIPPRSYEGFIRSDGVEFIVRATDAKLAYDWEASLRELINDRRDWDMRGIRVNQSRLVRDVQDLGSDPSGYLFNLEYQIERWS